METEKLKLLQNDIDKLDKIHHLKILKILKDNDIKYSENRNGIFVNMNVFDDKTIRDIENTLKYIKEQEKSDNAIWEFEKIVIIQFLKDGKSGYFKNFILE